jgi:predicted transcriptional regulator
MDYSKMDARFSNENAIKYGDLMGPSVTFEQIEPFLSKLPSREVDLLQLYIQYKKNQKQLAIMFGVTQGAISSRLSRARARLEFLKALPKITDEEIDKALSPLFDSMELEIIKTMMKTTCQSETAQLINEKFELAEDKKRMTQVKVRHRYEKCLMRLKEEMKVHPEYKKYYHLLEFIKNNLYKLHEVRLPHFDRGNAVLFSMEL